MEKGDEAANLVDSSLVGKRIERPLLSRGNTGSSLAKDLGVLVLAFPQLKPTATTRSGRRGSEHVRVVARRAVEAASLLRGAWLGEAARKAQAPLPWLRGVALETRTPVVEFIPRLRRTALRARVPFAEFELRPTGTARGMRVPVVEMVPWPRGTAFEARVPVASAAP